MEEEEKNVTRWKVMVKRSNGVIEFERVTLTQIQKIYADLKARGKKITIKQLTPLVLEHVHKRLEDSKVKSHISRIVITPD